MVFLPMAMAYNILLKTVALNNQNKNVKKCVRDCSETNIDNIFWIVPLVFIILLTDYVCAYVLLVTQ